MTGNKRLIGDHVTGLGHAVTNRERLPKEVL